MNFRLNNNNESNKKIIKDNIIKNLNNVDN